VHALTNFFRQYVHEKTYKVLQRYLKIINRIFV
jgi:hypothetical protein